MGLGIYIFLGLFVCDGGLMAISNRERRWTDLVWGFTEREGRLIWFGGSQKQKVDQFGGSHAP